MDSVRVIICRNPGCTLKEIIDELKEAHYSSTQSARGNIRVSLDKYVEWVYIDTSNKPYRYYEKSTQ